MSAVDAAAVIDDLTAVKADSGAAAQQLEDEALAREESERLAKGKDYNYHQSETKMHIWETKMVFLWHFHGQTMGQKFLAEICRLNASLTR